MSSCLEERNDGWVIRKQPANDSKSWRHKGMGNKIARTTQVSASEYYLHDLPSSYNLVLKEVLGRGRFFKSIQCKHDEGLVLVKVYFKRGSIDLRDYERRLFQIKEIFRALDHPHVWPFQVPIYLGCFVWLSRKCGYLGCVQY